MDVWPREHGPVTVFTPQSEAEAASIVAEARARGGALSLEGGGTQAGLGRPSNAAAILSSRGLTGITLHEPAELVISARAGTPLREVEAKLAETGQILPFEPVDLRTIYGTAGEPTIGGVVAGNGSGPRRIAAGAARDHLIGVRFVNGRGEVIKSGGRVMKNVTGLDLVKLQCGAHGTLGFLTEVTFKVLPKAQSATTLVFENLVDARAVELLTAALTSPFEVSGAAHVPAGLRLSENLEATSHSWTLLRLENFRTSLDYRCGRLEELLGSFARPVRLDETETVALWAAIRDVRPLAEPRERALWRISVPPGNGPEVIARVPAGLALAHFYDWGGGLIWLATADGGDAGAAAIRAALTPCGGHATLIRASDGLRAATPVFEPLAPALMALTRRIKTSFDPDLILNPGRMYADAWPASREPMQTNFSPAQLSDTHMQVSEKILRTCVHCGFCTATCPTYLLLGDELDSPRGRIYLIKDMLEGSKPATPEVVKHIDRCLSCLACMTTCPSGVHYMHLVDHARAHIDTTYQRPFADRMLRNVLAAVLPYRGRFRLALLAATLGKPLKPLVAGLPAVGRRLAAMLELAPAGLPPRSGQEPGKRLPSVSSRDGIRRRVAMLTGCAQAVLKPSINEAAIRLLNRHGVEVVLPKGEGCCGALVHHMGREHDALSFARRNVDAWIAEMDGPGLEAILITASGCGTTIKDYGFILRDDPAYADKAKRVSAISRDITEFLGALTLDAPAANTGYTVAYHSACSMQHGQKITDLPKRLLKTAGFRVMDVPEGHICCGSAGTYNILQPEIAGRLGSRKVGNIERLRPDLIATGNIGCMTQIGKRTAIPILHTVELLDWAHGGPKPEELESLPELVPALTPPDRLAAILAAE